MYKFDLIKFADDYNMSETIEFAIWLTGHDKETIIQMYNDFKNQPIRCYTNTNEPVA